MFSLRRDKKPEVSGLDGSSLHDEKNFYQAFVKDLKNCKEEVIIESPFITSHRMRFFRPVFNRLLAKGVKIYVITRDPKDHDLPLEYQSEAEIKNFEAIGVQTLICQGNHHRKLAILDRKVLWEGSLNILSQSNSREIMRRLDNKDLASEMFDFLRLKTFL